MAKITSSDAKILARLLERYVLDTSRSLQYGLREHPENPMNKLLLVELVEDMTVARKLYPMFAEGLNLDEQAKERTKRYNLPVHEIKEQAIPKVSEPQSIQNSNNPPPTEDDLRGLLKLATIQEETLTDEPNSFERI